MRHAPPGAPLGLPYADAPEADVRALTELIGRAPRAAFEVVVRGADGRPVVVRNAPLEHDGTPMPTRWWLVGPAEIAAVGRIEAAGGVRQAEEEVGLAAVDEAHRRYAAERDAALPPGWSGPRPSGGVGGTRRGVKCLHAHYAWFLAGGDDPVGAWVAARLDVGRAAGRDARRDVGRDAGREATADGLGA